jgi:hypothetical protein
MPTLLLSKVVGEFPQIAAALAERTRKRKPQIDEVLWS